MDIQVIAAVFLALAIVFIIGQIWFHLVDGILKEVRRTFTKKQTWYPLPDEEKEKIIDKR